MDPTALFQVSPVSGVPIYRQLCDQVLALIASGRLLPGDRMPSVRALGTAIQVNPMTVSKAYSLLERDNVLVHVRGHGMEVAHPMSSVSVKERQAQLLPSAQQLAATAFQLSLTREQVLEVLEPLLGHPEQTTSAPEAEVENE